MEEGVLIAENIQQPKVQFSAEQRLAICNECPLFIRGKEICNPALWMNPETQETSGKAKSGFIRGCGCLISRKARQPGSHCHVGLW